MPGDWLNNEGLLGKNSRRYAENLIKNIINKKGLACFHSQLLFSFTTCFHSQFNHNTNKWE